MPKFVFQDFDEFADAIEGVDGRFVPTGHSTDEWWVEVNEIGSIAVQQLQVGGATTFAGDGAAGSLTLGVPMSDPTRLLIDGHALDDESFIALKRGTPFAVSAREVMRWAGVTLPLDSPLLSPDICDGLLRSDAVRMRTHAARLWRLRDVVLRVSAHQKHISAAGAETQAQVQEEIALIAARALESASAWSGRRAGRRPLLRKHVIAVALEMMEAKCAEPVRIAELCQATCVSERTLRNIFLEYFGVGPMRLLKMRQLHHVRAALLEADSRQNTVSHIATKFGIWDFSALARDYRALFGELPSHTLRDKRAGLPAAHASWQDYAAKVFADARR